jgi:spoIIIJ-associated protein
MAEEIIISGKTVEEAMAAAAAKYSGENVSYEIAEMPRKGFLGIGSSPAKIKVTIGSAEEEDVDLKGIVSQVKDMKVTTNKGGSGAAEKAAKSEQPAKFDRSGAGAGDRRQKRDRYDRAEKTENTQKVENSFAAASPKAAEEASTAEKAKAAATPGTAPAPKAPAAREERAPRAEVTEAEKQYALEFVRTLLSNMGINAKADYAGTEESFDGEVTYPRIEIDGEGTGILIGHHGETLDAIQYLVNLTALRRGGSTQKEFVKIVVDIENYRAKREETLRALARRMAAKAVKYKRNILLEPMNPYERRIIHSEVQGIENVSTHSVGSDENRKIVITYEGPDKAERPYNRRGGYRKSN